MIFELHTHSHYSDGRPSPKQIVDHAREFLDGLAVTDHDVIEGSLAAKSYETEDFAIITGVEVSSLEGHILALDVAEPIEAKMSAQETVEKIHALGGLAVAAHPYDAKRRGVGDLVLDLPFDAVEVVNGHTLANKKDPQKICEEAGLSMVGGSDAHILEEVGSVTVEFEGDFRKALIDGKMKVDAVPVAKRLVNIGVGVVKRRILG